MINRIFQDTPFGRFGIEEGRGGICAVIFPTNDELSHGEETPLLREAFAQLREYFVGRRREFTIPLDCRGTEFYKRVWQALQEIPYGRTASYKEISERIGNPKAARAVGLANNRNPLPIFIPCHRVIGISGRLVGYVGGLEMKRRLLELEKNNT